MTSVEMKTTIGEELGHIPDFPGRRQGYLRWLYPMERRKSLGKNAIGNRSRGDVMRDCLKALQETFPGDEVHLDHEYFGLSPA